MDRDAGAEPLLSDPKRLLLDLAQAHSISELLRLIVTCLSDSAASPWPASGWLNPQRTVLAVRRLESVKHRHSVSILWPATGDLS